MRQAALAVQAALQARQAALSRPLPVGGGDEKWGQLTDRRKQLKEVFAQDILRMAVRRWKEDREDDAAAQQPVIRILTQGHKASRAKPPPRSKGPPPSSRSLGPPSQRRGAAGSSPSGARRPTSRPRLNPLVLAAQQLAGTPAPAPAPNR